MVKKVKIKRIKEKVTFAAVIGVVLLFVYGLLLIYSLVYLLVEGVNLQSAGLTLIIATLMYLLWNTWDLWADPEIKEIEEEVEIEEVEE